jgi:PEGA domain
MPAHSRRHTAAEHDDPWGFGSPEGTFVEVRYDPHVAPADRVAPVAPVPPIRREVAPPADPRAIDLTPGGGKAARGVPPEPAGDARLQLGPPPRTEAYQNYFRPPHRDRRWRTAAMALGLALAVGGGYVWLVRGSANGIATPLPVGTFVLSSQPAGAEVLLDGVAVGRTPLALQLTPGDHTVVATSDGGVSQRLTARVAAGESAAQHVVLDGSQSALGASAAVDQAPRAASPPRDQAPVAASTRGVQPPVSAPPSRNQSPVSAATTGNQSQAAVSGRRSQAPARAPVDVGATSTQGGADSSRPAPAPGASPPVPAAAARTPGFVTFDLPFSAHVFERGELLGSTGGGRLRVAPGTHTFTLVSAELGFRSQETVVVAPGRATRHVVEQQSAPLSVNALPWAEVFISGRSFGETPLANIALPIGTYQVTLRHPTLGEREVAVTVRLGTANRLAVDMRR